MGIIQAAIIRPNVIRLNGIVLSVITDSFRLEVNGVFATYVRELYSRAVFANWSDGQELASRHVGMTERKERAIRGDAGAS